MGPGLSLTTGRLDRVRLPSVGYAMGRGNRIHVPLGDTGALPPGAGAGSQGCAQASSYRLLAQLPPDAGHG